MPDIKMRLSRWAYLVLFAVLSPVKAIANPAGATVVGGSATIVATPSELQIHQTSGHAIINWNSFNIGSGETTHFYQPGASAVALNRVVNSTQLSAINGNLQANGHVFVINPNGVLIGNGAHINTAGFIASSADIADNAFLNSTGTYDFNIAGDSNASVINQGHVTIQDEGLVAMVAPTVRNQGVITGNLGKVNLIAGDTFGIDMYGDGLFYVAVSPQNTDKRHVSVINTGSIVTDGGKVLITAAAANAMVSSAINNTGVIEAASLANHNGEIILEAIGGHIASSGSLDVSGIRNAGLVSVKGHDVSVAGTVKAKSTASGHGGTVTLAGTHDTSIDGVVDVSGVDGGGTISALAHDLAVGSTGNVTAEATATGQGGLITLTSSHIASLYGTVNASGLGGGGNINISSRDISVGDTGNIVARASGAGTGGIISLSSVNNTRIHGAMNADGVDNGGDINVHTHKIYTDTAADISAAGTTGGTIGLTADTLIDLSAGKFNARDFNLVSPTVNFSGDTNVIKADLALDAGTVNLDALILDPNNVPITAPSRFSSNAQAVNVLSDSAMIQQGIDLAGSGAVVTVSSGTYLGAISIDRPLTLQGNGSLPTLTATQPQPALITIAADDVMIRGLSIDGNGSTSGITMTGNNDVSITNNYILNSGIGLSASAFDNGNITLSGNQFTNNELGASFASGLIDLRGGANVFTGGNAALLFQRITSGSQVSDLAFASDTLGSTTFQGQTGLNTGRQYIAFENGSFFAPGNPTHIDGTQAVFDGIKGEALTASQLEAVQGRIHDFNDDSTLGLIFLTPGGAVSGGNLSPFRQLNPLGRPIISVADKVINYYPPFEPIETRVLDVDVSIKLPPQNPPALASIEPAAGGSSAVNAESLANLEPAAGGTVGNDIACANAYLDNKPCITQ